jgi:TRAP transporter TAXI family solute receptor
MNIQFFSENKWTTLIGTIVLVGGMALAYKYARPAVPKEVVMSTGGSGGAYESFAKRYAAALAEEGIKLTLRPSKGATENLSRLLDATSGVDIALVQNGLIEREKAEETPLESLGSFFYEPVLVFYRPQSFKKPVQSLGDLVGKRIAVGAEGSGTRVLAISLLELHDIKVGAPSVLLDLGGEDAAAALREGKIDVALFVGSATAPLIQSLFRDASLRVADLDYAETYARRLSQVTAVSLPAGVIDVAAGLPAQSVRTVATTSSLVARDDLHPAVTFLLMRAAKRMHGGAGPVSKVNEFPTFTYAQDFLPSADAERLLKEGTPFLYRYLPFKFANFISRGIVFLIPLLAVLLSLSDWIPKLIGMRVKSKLFAHYKEMKTIDEAIRGAKGVDELNAASAQLDSLDADVGRLKIPAAHSNDQFGVRDHMDLVRVRIERKRDALSVQNAE